MNSCKLFLILAMSAMLPTLAEDVEVSSTDSTLNNPNPNKYCWKLEGEAPSISGEAIHFELSPELLLPGGPPPDPLKIARDQIREKIETKRGNQKDYKVSGTGPDTTTTSSLDVSNLELILPQEDLTFPYPINRGEFNPSKKFSVKVKGTYKLNKGDCPEPEDVTVEQTLELRVTLKRPGGGGRDGDGYEDPFVILPPIADPPIIYPPRPPYPPIIIGPPIIIEPPIIIHPPPPPPSYGDADCDGVLDYIESFIGTDPGDPDTDHDGLADGYELDNNLNPNIVNDLSEDRDLDGLTLAKEFEYGCDPNRSDSDQKSGNTLGDGLPDTWEILHGTDPLDAGTPSDKHAGRMGITNIMVFANEPLTQRSDDWLPDYLEGLWKTDVGAPDSDSDGMDDWFEVVHGFSPSLSDLLEVGGVSTEGDKDGDALGDVFEYGFLDPTSSGRLSPIDYDTDWDGIPDKWENDRVSAILPADQYNPLSNQNRLICWLRLDKRSEESGNVMQVVNSAMGYANSFKSDSLTRGSANFTLAVDLRKLVLNFGGGVSGFVTIPDSRDLLNREQFTCGVRVNLRSLGCVPEQRLFYQDGVVDVRRRTDGLVSAAFTGSNGGVVTLLSASPMPYNSWHHVAVSVCRIAGSDTSEATLYVDGVAVDQEPIVRSFATAAWPFHLGSANSIPLLAPAGSFSDFRIYDAVLSSQEFEYWADLKSLTREENRDPDQDGVPNWLEFEFGANPLEVDSDLDQVGDYEEIYGKVRENTVEDAPRVYSSPHLTDSDGDGLSDYAERHGSQPTNPYNADTDGDKFLDSEEFNLPYLNAGGQTSHPDPRIADTDGDGMNDFDEVKNRRNPLLNPEPFDPFPPAGVNSATDTDGDGLTDFSEHYEYGTNPNLNDTFGDGIGDYGRVSFGLIGPLGNINSNPMFGAGADFDADGISNAAEIKTGSNPMQSSNMGASLVQPKTLDEIPEITESQAKAEGREFVWAPGTKRLLLPDNAKALIMQGSEGTSDWIVLNSLELSGRKSNGEEVATTLNGVGGETDPGWKHVGQSPTSAYGSIAPQDVSGFINGLERDAEGYVTIVVRNLATHPVKPDPDVPDDALSTIPDLGFMGSNGGWGGLGGGLGGYTGGGVIFDPWVNVLEILQPLFGEETKVEPQKPFPVYGSTAVALRVMAVDIDARSAGATGPFMVETKEAVSAAVVSPTEVTQTPANIGSAARIRIYPTGAEGGKRRLQWPATLHLFYNNSFLQRTADGYEIPEAASTVEMVVFSDLNSPAGGSISLSGFEANGDIIGTDSVNFTDVPVQVGVFPDEVTYISADTPEDTILFSVDTLEENSETSAMEMTAVADGSKLGIKVKKGEGGTWQEKDEIQTESGIATYKIETSTHDKDTYYVKAYVKSVNRSSGDPLSFGDAAKNLGEASDDPTNHHSGLLGFSEKIEVVPGIPIAHNFISDPLEYPADGESEMVVTATPKDANNNSLRPGTSVTWSMDGYGFLKESDTEIKEGGTTVATLLSKEKRTDEFFQTAFLHTSNPIPFQQAVGNLKMSATATSPATDVVIGGDPVVVEATFTAEGGADLEGRTVVWYCSNGKFTYDTQSTQLDANGKARIWVNGNGANVGQGIVFAQAGTAAAKVVLDYVVMPGTVSIRIKDPLLAVGTASAGSDVEISGPPGAVVEIGFAGAWAMDSTVPVSGSQYGPSDQDSRQPLFKLSGLNSRGEVQLDEAGKRTIRVQANYLPDSSNLDFSPLAQVALVGTVKSVPSGQDVSSFHVHPGRIVSMPENLRKKTLDVLKGFVWGDSSNLTQAGGELALAMIPYGGGIGDCRDMVREVCRWIMPGGSNADWTNFNLALVSLVAELIPGGGTVTSVPIGTVKIALNLIKKLLLPITTVGVYHEELREFLNFTTRALGNYFANADFAGGKRFLDENGIVELLEFLSRSATESGLISSNTLPSLGNSALLYTVSTGAASDGFRKVVKGLSTIAKDKEGLFEFGRALRKFDNADFRFRLGNYLTEISEQTLETSGKSGATIAKKMHAVLNSSKFPKELADMLQTAHPDDAVRFFTDMAKVFAKTNLKSTEMRKILQMKLIYDPYRLRSAIQPANVMTAGELMENIAKVADSHGADGLQVIKGLAKYADKAVDGSGNISNGSWNWFGPIIHGRRAEIEYLAKHPDATPGTHVTFEVVKEGKQAKIVSDVDAFRNGAAISIKRQGKTLDEWARPGNKSDEWLTAYMTKIQEGLTVDGKVVLPASSQLVFRTGKELPSAATQERLKRIGKDIFGAGNVKFEVMTLLPPPAIN